MPIATSPTLWVRDRNNGNELHINEEFAWYLEERDPGRFELIDGPSVMKAEPVRRIVPPTKRITPPASKPEPTPEAGTEDDDEF